MRPAGIYVHPQQLLAYRAWTVHAAPDSEDWILVSEDTMIGLARVRELVRELGLAANPAAIQWTGRTDVQATVIP